MCSCGKKTGGCSTKRGELKKFKVEMSSLYASTDSQELKTFLETEIGTINTLVKNLKFCPTKEYLQNYKEEVNATISEFS